MTVLGPVCLPMLNLMLDVPEAAVGLAALALFIRAESGKSSGLAALAGVVAGLAAETKYSGLVLPGVFLAHAATHRGWRRWAIATAATIAVFAGVEALIALRYGESHFLHNIPHHRNRVMSPVTMAQDLVETGGGLAPAVSIIALAGLGLPNRLVARLGLVTAAGYVLVGLVPGRMNPWWCARVFFIGVGTLFLVTMAAAGVRLIFGRWPPRAEISAAWRDDCFVVLWFVVEVAGYFALSPFPAYRRFIGIVIAGTFVAGRLASRTCSSPQRIGLVRGAAIGGALLGVFFYGIDSCEAVAKKRVAEDAVALVRRQAAPNTKVWFFCQWGTSGYLEREGFQFIHAGRSRLRPGDWVIQVEGGSLVTLPDAFVVQVARLERSDFLPWAVNPLIPSFPAPLVMRRFKGEPRAVARVYRVEQEFVVPDWPSPK